MIGTIDEHSRVFVDVLVRSHPDSVPVPVAVWIDTAFDGHLVFPMAMILQLQLEALAETDAILADGSQTTLETFLCYVDWFGDRVPLPASPTTVVFRCLERQCSIARSCISIT